MKFQLVTLKNDDKDFCNDCIESYLLESGILSNRYGKVTFGKHSYYPGKKVQFTKNTKPAKDGGNYDTVRNGELGQVASIVEHPQGYVMKLTNGKKVILSMKEDKTCVNPYMNLQAGYACTCNKAQGSEWPSIIFYVPPNPWRGFTREFAYVAVSRAKERCIVIGTEKDFNYLCAEKAKERNTLLSYYLRRMPITELEEVQKGEIPVVLPLEVPTKKHKSSSHK